MLKNCFKFSLLSLLLIVVFASNAFAFDSVKFAIREICGHMQGNLGGLLMTVAGIGGITAAAFGNLRASHSLIVVGVGAVAISTVLSLYFPKAAKECSGNNQLQGVDGNGQGAANLARVTAGNDLLERKNFEESAVAIASGKDADFSNQLNIQETDDDVEFDPGADDVAEGF